MKIPIVIASFVTVVTVAHLSVSYADQGNKRDSSVKQTPYEEGSVKQEVKNKDAKKKEVKKGKVKKDTMGDRHEPSRLPDPCRMSSPPPECP